MAGKFIDAVHICMAHFKAPRGLGEVVTLMRLRSDQLRPASLPDAATLMAQIVPLKPTAIDASLSRDTNGWFVVIEAVLSATERSPLHASRADPRRIASLGGEISLKLGIPFRMTPARELMKL